LTITHMNWFIFMGRSMARWTMTSLNISILLKQLLWRCNNKISVWIDVTTK
jgi:hypothetical protein